MFKLKVDCTTMYHETLSKPCNFLLFLLLLHMVRFGRNYIQFILIFLSRGYLLSSYTHTQTSKTLLLFYAQLQSGKNIVNPGLHQARGPQCPCPEYSATNQSFNATHMHKRKLKNILSVIQKLVGNAEYPAVSSSTNYSTNKMHLIQITLHSAKQQAMAVTVSQVKGQEWKVLSHLVTNFRCNISDQIFP